MVQRLVTVVLVAAGLAACAAPSSERFYPSPGTPYAVVGGPVDYEAAPVPEKLPDPAATRDAPRGPPPMPSATTPMLDLRDQPVITPTVRGGRSQPTQ